MGADTIGLIMVSRNSFPTMGVETALAFGTLRTRRVHSRPELLRRRGAGARRCGRYAAQETADDPGTPCSQTAPNLRGNSREARYR